MKKLAVLILVICVACLYGCNEKKANTKEMLISDNVKSDVLLKKSSSPYGSNFSWFRSNLEDSKREFFISLLMDSVFSGKVKAYQCLADGSKSDKILTTDEIKKLITVPPCYDTLTFTKTSPPYYSYDTVIYIEKQPDSSFAAESMSLKFIEEWTVDTSTLQLKKAVKGMCPTLLSKVIWPSMIDNINKKYQRPLFWIYFDDKPVQKENKKLLAEKIMYEVPINDTIGNENISYPKMTEYIDMLINALKSGKIKAYDASVGFSNLDDYDNNKTISYTDLLSLFKNDINYIHKANLIRFIEEWYIDIETLQIEKNVDGICFISKEYDEDKQFKGMKPMFWIFFNDKYPVIKKFQYK